MKILEKHEVGFRRKDVLQIVVLRRKCIYSKKDIKNIVFNYISHETIICNNRNPPWINKNVRKLINGKNYAYTSSHQNENNSSTFKNFQFLQSRLNSLIQKSKHSLSNRNTSRLCEICSKLIIKTPK